MNRLPAGSPSGPPAGGLRVLHFTDTHLHTGSGPMFPPGSFADAAFALTGRTTNESAAAVASAARAEALRSGSIDLVIHTGDMVDTPSRASYDTGADLLRSFNAPIMSCPGNHDLRDLMSSTLGATVGDQLQVKDIGGWRIILLRSAEYGRQAGRLGHPTLELLSESLRCNLNVLLGMHHPPLSPCNHADCINEDASRILDLIDDHHNVAAVVSGHLHMAQEMERHGVSYLLGPSTAFQVRHVHPLREHNTEPTPAGARIIDLGADGSLSTTLVWA